MTSRQELHDPLVAAGLAAGEVASWIDAWPQFSGDALSGDAGKGERFWRLGEALRRTLPAKPDRATSEHQAASVLLAAMRETRTSFLRWYADLVYRGLTGDLSRFVRVEDLVYDAAERFPGLTPTRGEVQAERIRLQKDKDGSEIDQGLLIGALLSRREPGLHLLHAMLRPTAAALDTLVRFQREGALDLGAVHVERQGVAGIVTFQNARYLNAEDDDSLPPFETAVDLVLLDPAIEIGVLRGGVVDHPKYAGRRVFSAGINLTHLYQGTISFVDFYLTRDLGVVNKLYRGLTGAEFRPDEPEATLEKPWIAAVEAFAIGGGCQLLLTVDRVIAERGAFFNLPARKEGIIPGAAPLRLPRFVGDRLARQGIFYERSFAADSPEGALLCDEVVERGEMDEAIARTVAGLTSSGVVSAAANRTAMRVGQEPLDLFRQYMATYAIEQAHCHFSPALFRNLEENWNAKQRTRGT